MTISLDDKSWLFCTRHLIALEEDDHGSCPLCNGDRYLIVVVPASKYQEFESSSLDDINLVILLAQKLSKDLDSNNSNSVEPVSKIILDMPVELMLVFSRQVGMDRIIENYLDDNPIFKSILETINKQT